MLQHICGLFLWLIHLSAQSTMNQNEPKSPACNGDFSNKASGTIESPRSLQMYGSHRLCNYAITVAPKQQISLRFEYVRLNTFGNVLMDYVVVFDGPDCMAARTAVVQRSQQTTVVSTSNQMTVLFVSNSMAGDVQFSAKYFTVSGQSRTQPVIQGDKCGGELSQKSGTFAFKADGSINVLCIWRINVDEGNIVRLHFTELKLDSDTAWLRVLDGGHCGAPLLKLFTKNEAMTNLELNATSNLMTVVYASPLRSDTAKVEATYWEESATASQTTELVPLLPSDLVTDAENMANNPAVAKKFDLAASLIACAFVGALVLLLAAI